MPLKLVTDELEVTPESLNAHTASRGELEEIESVLRTIYPAARRALFELFDACEARDVDAVAAAERRLLAAGLLAKDSADRLQGGQT